MKGNDNRYNTNDEYSNIVGVDIDNDEIRNNEYKNNKDMIDDNSRIEKTILEDF